MSRRMNRRRAGTSRPRAVPTKLFVECLEERSLLSASGLPATTNLSHLLVGYRDQGAAVVRRVELAAHESFDQALAAYRANPNVLFAEGDFRVQSAVVPNDPYFGDHWGLHNTGQGGGTADADIDAPEAWDITTGSTRTVIAVIDSGIDYTHRDLYRNLWVNQGEIPQAVKDLLIDVDGDGLFTLRDLNDARNQGAGKITDLNGNGYIDGGDLLYSVTVGGWADGVSGDGDGYVDDIIGWNFVTNTNNPYDDNGHGTHVAGTIGATGNNGTGVVGVNWDVQLVGLKFLDATGGGYISAATSALNYAVAKGIKVSNNSWGGGGYSQAFYDALTKAQAQGHVFVAAAGNGGSDGVGDNNDTYPSYPSSYNVGNVLAVAATDRNDRLASFSNFGATSVDVAAPGVDILSTVPGGYAYYSGTSMATPYVAGVVALVQSQNPGWTYSQVISQILNNADKVSGLTGKVATGARLNAYGALSAGTVADTTGPRVVSAAPNATSGPVSSVRVTFSEAIDPATFTAADVTNFAGPNGAVAVSGVVAVSGSGNTQFDITFATQSAPGTYQLSVGPDVRDASGNRMDQDQDGVPGESTEDRYTAQFTVSGSYTYSSSPNLAILDGYRTVASITVNQDVTVADLNVKLNIAHSYDADLRMYLVAPDGTAVLLVNFRGGSGDNFTNTVLDDEAATHVAYGRAPFSGSYRPEWALSAFDGKNARGTWQLWVEDWYRRNTGTLKSWSVTFEGAAGASAQAAATGQGPAPKSLPAPVFVSSLFPTAIVAAARSRAALPAFVPASLLGGRAGGATLQSLATSPARPANSLSALPATKAGKAVSKPKGNTASKASAGVKQASLSAQGTANSLAALDRLMALFTSVWDKVRRR